LRRRLKRDTGVTEQDIADARCGHEVDRNGLATSVVLDQRSRPVDCDHCCEYSSVAACHAVLDIAGMVAALAHWIALVRSSSSSL
jgi:hypothetical protein